MKIFALLILLIIVSFNTFASETKADTEGLKKGEATKYFWVPGVEINSIQGISVPQHFLFCISCSGTYGRHGPLGEYFLIEASPGYLGGSVSLGASLLMGYGNTSLTAKLTTLRSWNTGFNVVEKNTYVGPEISVTLLFVDIELGILRNLTNNNSNDQYLFSFGIGVGM